MKHSYADLFPLIQYNKLLIHKTNVFVQVLHGSGKWGGEECECGARWNRFDLQSQQQHPLSAVMLQRSFTTNTHSSMRISRIYSGDRIQYSLCY